MPSESLQYYNINLPNYNIALPYYLCYLYLMEIESNDKVGVEILAGLVKKSDEKAFNTLFDLLWEPMYTYATSIIMNDSLAKDIVQDLWVDYWQRRENIEIHHIKAYLYKAIRYRCYNYLRDNKFNQTQLDIANSICIASEVEQNEDVIELSKQINQILSNLPQRCQEVFRLSRINDFNNKEIAKRLNISQRSVENQISLALRKLRKDLSMARIFLFS